MEVSFASSIHQIEANNWNVLWPHDNPFCRHEFLAALEDSGSTSSLTGWRPTHALLRDGGHLCGAMPLFAKSHSYGEYVFDWAWADAYAGHGLDYYPKLVNAIPFTPSTGPRLGLAASLGPQQKQAAVQALHTAITTLAQKQGYSGWHSLFPEANDQALLARLPMAVRYGYQFHWFNQGFSDFDDFLTTFSSRKRKNLRKERQRVADAGLTLRRRTGSEVPAVEWQQFYALYQGTYLKRSGNYGYLGPSFFARLAEAMPNNLLLVSAHQGDTMVAAAFYLRDTTTLYGRYWGAMEDFDGLHFEACYYQGIDYAIENRLQRFDPGAQGEHKIQRGFVPVRTCSYHWLAEPAFADAVARYCAAEASHVTAYIDQARTLLPFREGSVTAPADVLLHQY